MDSEQVMRDDVFRSEVFLRLSIAERTIIQLRTEKEALGAQVTDLQAKASNLEQEMQTRVLSLEQELQTAQAAVATSAAANEKAAITAELNEEITRLKSANTSLTTQNASQAEQHRVLQHSLSLSLEDNRILRGYHQTLVVEVGALKQKIAEYQQGAETQASTAVAEKAELTQRLQLSAAEIETLKEQLANEQALKLTESESVAKLTDGNAQLKASLENAIGEIGAKSQQIENMQREREVLNVYIQELDEKDREQQQILQQQQTELEAEVNKSKGLQDMVTELRGQLASALAELGSLREAANVVRVDREVQVQSVAEEEEKEAAEEEQAPQRVMATIATQTEQQSPITIRIPAVSQAASSAAQASIRQTPSTTQRAPRRGRQESSGLAADTLPASDNEIPPARLQLLDSFPEIDVPLSALGESAAFGRSFLAAMLGGGLQGVVGAFAKDKPRKPISMQFDLEGCLYPQRRLNPWLPCQPGDHGFLFLGLCGPGNDHLRFFKPETHALFIFEKTQKIWKYYGQYSVLRTPENDLTVEEWNALSDQFKDGDDGYCAMTLNKSMGGSKYSTLKKDSKAEHDRQVQAIRAQYDAGELRVPCISLQCLEYNEALVAALASNVGGENPKPTSVSSSSGLKISLKRKRSSEGEDEENHFEDGELPAPTMRLLRSHN